MSQRQIKLTLPEKTANLLEEKANRQGMKLASYLREIILNEEKNSDDFELMKKQINDLHLKFFEQE